MLVCDGYDTDNLLHINWGWGGYQTAIFVSALKPGGSGTGGGGDGGYNLNSLFVTVFKYLSCCGE